MGIFFGTDGIRGVVNDTLTHDLAYKCGNALGVSKHKPKILIGGDTRTTRSFLTCSLSSGAMNAGADVLDIGICPTAGIATITKKLGYDYGIVISASHNPANFNGIKIFDSDGFKLSDKKEDELERKFINQLSVNQNNVGNYSQDESLTKIYEDTLVNSCQSDLTGLTILLDCSNGAAHKIAPAAFRRLGAKVIATHSRDNGEYINHNCGSLFPETLSKAVKKYKADMGFAFDGDSDRIIACDENGNILDGDIIIYILAKYMQVNGNLTNNTVVGTRHTNMGLEKSLNASNITLLRTDIGDKYVISKIEEKKLSLGGEKSGHIIFREYSTTGDGILAGIKLAEMIKALNKPLSMLAKVSLYPQCNIDCEVFDKMKIINSEILAREIEIQEKFLGENSRIMVRVSGTEPKIRIMTECLNAQMAETSAKAIQKTIQNIDI